MQTAHSNNAAPLALALAGKLLAHYQADRTGKGSEAPRSPRKGHDKDRTLRPGYGANGEVIMLPPGCAG